MDFPQFGNVSFAKEINRPGIELLPHRTPFLFVDRLVACDDKGCIGEMTYGPDQYFFRGHFPEYPIVPGVILVETMAQTAGAGLVADGYFGAEKPLFFLAGVEGARFRQQVRPGDKLTTVVENTRIAHGLGNFTVKGFVQKPQADGAFSAPALAVQAVVKCMLPQAPKA